jgi:hypothetical protein
MSALPVELLAFALIIVGAARAGGRSAAAAAACGAVVYARCAALVCAFY